MSVPEHTSHDHDVVIIGGGSAGIATAASLLKRRPGLDIAVLEPSGDHYYQPGWTMVGGGVFDVATTRRSTASVMPRHCHWYRQAAMAVEPELRRVTLGNGDTLGYRRLVVAPGLVLDWDAIDGLSDTLGRNGVTSNYRYDLAPYTWSQVTGLSRGKALFSQPPMPIKCAGAPQKAMYLSADHWRREGCLGNIDVSFHNAGAVLFGVPDYVPALQHYIDRYGIDVHFQERLVAVDGDNRVAHFLRNRDDGEQALERPFDLLHVVPPQRPPAFIAESGLGNADGWLELEPDTLRHARYATIFGLGDASATSNAKTMAAARKQAPVVAENLLASLDDQPLPAAYLGYGSCPLTVERGRIVLAEFGYGGQLQPTFPGWVNEGTRATRRAWWLKAKQLPWVYWHGMLKGHEWFARPAKRSAH